MVRIPKLLAMLALWGIAGGAVAQSPAPQSPSTPVEWSSMSRAKVAVPLPASGPMASELSSRPSPPKWADVPLPPPPGARPGAKPGAKPALAPAAQEFTAPPPSGAAAMATGGGVAAIAAQDYSAPPAGEGGPGEAKVKSAVDQTGAMITITQDLDSDRIRQDWAAKGGTIPGFELNAGMTLLYKNLSEQAGEGAYMSGVGFNVGGRVVLLTLEPPKYETRDKNWTAWKIGGGLDLGALTTTIYTPPIYVLGRQVGGGEMTASVSTMTLVGTFGFMKAFGSFDSPSEWSGFAIGADWAPSYQKMSMTDSQSGTVTENTSFNAAGFAINFESGSMQSMASKMGKKAKMKVSLFFLPPTGDIPFMMTASIAAVWY